MALIMQIYFGDPQVGPLRLLFAAGMTLFFVELFK